MSALCTVTYCHRPLWLRLLKPVRIAMLESEIASADRWVIDTRNGAVFDAEQLAEIEANITPLRVQLAWWMAC